MPIIPPNLDLVIQQFSQFRELSLLTSGGFKVVYTGEISGRAEALKLIEIPNDPEAEDIEAFRNEIFGRAKREIDALEKCAIPELVKLGTLHPTRVGDHAFHLGIHGQFFRGEKLFARNFAVNNPAIDVTFFARVGDGHRFEVIGPS